MVQRQLVQAQLRKIGSDFRFWGSSEVRELPNIMFPDETLKHALNGSYEKGFAVLCATDERLLLLDKKPFILCMEDMRYEMISEVDYTEQLFSARLTLRTPGRTLEFVSFKIAKVRKLTSYIQERVTYSRHPSNDQEQHRQQPSYERFFEDQQPYRSMQQEVPYPQSPHRGMTLKARRRIAKFAPPPAEPHNT